MNVKPVKLLQGVVTQSTELEYWTESNISEDPWYGYPYRWSITMSISGQAHSDPETETPYYYDGNDVKVGDWIASGNNGVAVCVAEIVSATVSQVVLIVEDIERFNTYSDSYQSGYGGPSLGRAILFELNEDGVPILVGVPPNVFPQTMVTDLQGRFAYRNLQTTYVRVDQPSHNLALGDVIRPDLNNSGQFVPASADTDVDLAIGIVTSVGVPGTSWYTFRPLGKILNNITPALVGSFGDLFYIDPANPGKLTNVKPTNNARPIYMRLERNDRGMLLERTTSDFNETRKFSVVATENQVEFTMPADAEIVLYMSINGIENEEFTFDSNSKVLIFDPVANGYGVDSSDEVFFIYKS